MKTIGVILLVIFLGFSGCGRDSDAGTATVHGKANPVAPFGIIDIMTPSFEWTSVSGAVKYRLLVQDEEDAVVIDEWYTTEESGCASEEVSCTVHPDIVTTGKNTWKVQACANQECGSWSEPLHYDMRPSPISTSERYTDWGDGTVTDKTTGLMWQFHSDCEPSNWPDAISCCENSTYAGHDDWFLPTLSMLSNLNYQCYSKDGRYESRHPIFYHGIPFWTASSWTDTYGSVFPYAVHFGSPIYGIDWASKIYLVRCVRYDTEHY